ncbi:3-oxoacyl-[acyl-carrier protein] reductase [Marinobacterium lacunae]|uniref:3-oxoacyl-[acyl-carrier protein] reductase n=1 Tax=Marinobacterium lacunae TaxID=1232683 RepID=A0A081G380_9GAMM|nr:SDR family oxidoreductase [Marinobacterium lacunae]KEA65235.1 3-oxoacyl-[acyl-carrier protein] reductase [Marinobacterium lacunae]
MNVNLTGRVAIVTGSGQGIGAGIAQVFADNGAHVIVATRTASSGEDTVKRISESGGSACLHQCDIGQRASVTRLIEHCIERFGRLDILIHNAAVYPMRAIEDLADEELDTTLNVNLKAAFWLAKDALPYLRQSPCGRIIFTSSVTGPRVAMPETAHYAASKSGLNGFIRTAAIEFARDNITVNGVEPGYILTPAMTALTDDEGQAMMAGQIPAGKLGQATDIAYAMLYLASEQASYVTGQTLVVDGGSTLPESPVLLDAFYNAR